MTISIYHPSVRAEALRSGITDLQAYRKLQQREVLIRRKREEADRAIAELRSYPPIAPKPPSLATRIENYFERRFDYS